ncbi:transcription initiation factor IIA subunit 1-like [Babylonia areolata]|uniref:transcription initiation factor IIA subunit 1-like n=1 Tax=Babylonia areolata TaxID=304850 RepID=UPI003FD25E6C
MACSNDVSSLYKTVVDDVMNNVKEFFLDEGVDEQVLLELRQLWESKLTASKAMEPVQEPKIHLTAPAMGLLFQGQPGQQNHQGYMSSGAVLTTAVQQPPQAVIATAQPELTGAAQQAAMALPVGLFQQQIAALSGQPGLTLQPTANGQYIAVQNIGGQTTTFAIPQQALISAQPQQVIPGQQVAATVSQGGAANTSQTGIVQLDGTGDGSSSSDDDDFDNDDNDDDNDEDQNDDEAEEGEEEEPLNSGDDVSEEDPTELFDADSVIVCQYDKINRIKNKWKFQLKDGIMNLNGKDFVFQRATGDAEW